MLPSPMDCRNFTLAARPHKTKSYATFSQHVHVHVHVHLPSRQDAQPPVPWRHTVEGADFNRSHNKKLLQNLNRQERYCSRLRLFKHMPRQGGVLAARWSPAPLGTAGETT